MALQRPLAEPLVDLVSGRLCVLGHPIRVRLIDRVDRLGEAHVQVLADELAANAAEHLQASRGTVASGDSGAPPGRAGDCTRWPTAIRSR